MWEGIESRQPSHPKIWLSKSWKDNGGLDEWKQIKSDSGSLKAIKSFTEFLEKNGQSVQRINFGGKEKIRKHAVLLNEYVRTIGKGAARNEDEKIFGRSGKSTNRCEVKEYDGSRDETPSPDHTEGKTKASAVITARLLKSIKKSPGTPNL